MQLRAEASPNVGNKRRRVRRQPAKGQSALAKMGQFDDPQDTLNEATPDVRRCAWPGCRGRMVSPYKLPGETEHRDERYGVLCEVHAVDVATAVIAHQRSLMMVEHFFAQQTTDAAIRYSKWKTEQDRHEAEKAAIRGDRDGFVYYIRVGERIKVGYSGDVKQRMRKYPPGSTLLAVEPGDRDVETQRHRQFAGSRSDGREWFRPTPDLMELIDELVSVHGDPRRFAHHYRRNEQPLRVRPAS